MEAVCCERINDGRVTGSGIVGDIPLEVPRLDPAGERIVPVLPPRGEHAAEGSPSLDDVPLSLTQDLR